MTIDLLPTLADLVGGELPSHPIDGRNVWPIIAGEPGAKNPHEAYYFYYQNNQLQAVLSGRWKLQLPHSYRTLGGRAGGRDGRPVSYEQGTVEAAELYDLDADVGEARDLAAEHPEIVHRLKQLAEQARADLGDSLTDRKGSGQRPPGRVP